MKKCNKCLKRLSLSNFNRATRSPDGLSYSCRLCDRALSRAWYEANKNRANEYTVLRRHGVTPEEYNQMLSIQGGVCAICKKPERHRSNGPKVKRLAVDHDHTTGEVRGLLCNNCNRALGLFGDDVTALQAAIDYLSRVGELT